MKRRETRARVRIAIGLLSGLIFPCAAALNMKGEPPQKILVGKLPNWTLSFILSAKDGATETAGGNVTNCNAGPSGFLYSIAPEGADYFSGRLLCERLLTDTPSNVDALTVASFDDGSNRTSIVVPPMGAVDGERKTKWLGPLVNEGDQVALITTFSEVATLMHVEIRDGRNIFESVRETFTIQPGAGQFRISVEGVVFVRVGMGHPIYGCGRSPADCLSIPPVYGFVSSGDARGGNFRAFPF